MKDINKYNGKGNSGKYEVENINIGKKEGKIEEFLSAKWRVKILDILLEHGEFNFEGIVKLSHLDPKIVNTHLRVFKELELITETGTELNRTIKVNDKNPLMRSFLIMKKELDRVE